MRRLFHFDPRTSSMAERDAGRVDSCRSEEGWCWLDLALPTEAELASAAEAFDLGALRWRGLPDEIAYPKVDQHPGYTHVVFHTVTTADQRLATADIHLFVGPDFIVSIRRSAVIAADWLAETVHAASTYEELTPGLLGAVIAEAAVRRFLPLLDALDQRILVVEDMAIRADPTTLAENQVLRREIILLRQAAGPQREVFRHLSQAGGAHIDNRAARAYGDVYDLLFRIVESLDSARALLTSALETHRGAVAERTNEVMKILTVYSAIMLPLGLIAGLWGMNFNNIPGSDWRWGFVGILLLMAGIAGGLYWYFTSRQIIGGPKLYQLPRVVGLGIVHIGTAPVRLVVGSRSKPAPDETPETSATDDA